MKKEFLIKALNVNSAEALTLEKAEDRLEFQAFISPDGATSGDCDEKCTVYCSDWGDPEDPCDPMDPGTPPDVPPPTEVPCPELK